MVFGTKFRYHKTGCKHEEVLMVFESLKKMLGRGDDNDKDKSPPKPVLEQGSTRSTSRQGLSIPSPDDMSDLPPGPGGPSGPPEPQRGGRESAASRRRERLERARSNRGQREQPRGSIPRRGRREAPPQRRRRKRGASRQERGGGDNTGWEAPDRSRIMGDDESGHRMSSAGPKGDADSMILDHLDRIENRLEDIDRRLSMLESRYRLRQ